MTVTRLARTLSAPFHINRHHDPLTNPYLSDFPEPSRPQSDISAAGHHCRHVISLTSTNLPLSTYLYWHLPLRHTFSWRDRTGDIASRDIIRFVSTLPLGNSSAPLDIPRHLRSPDIPVSRLPRRHCLSPPFLSAPGITTEVAAWTGRRTPGPGSTLARRA